MKKRQWILTGAGLAMICLGTAFLWRLHSHQRLGPPAVKTVPSEDRKRLSVQLPAEVLDYNSAPVEEDKLVLDTLPKDTSFGARRYVAPDGFETLLNVVLMGADRTSLHKPEFCLEGQGWRIDRSQSSLDSVSMEKPYAYTLPVMKLISRKRVGESGQEQLASGVYVYWFVAENAYTANHWKRMWWMARGMLQTGVLQRWAYVSCFAVCHPGQEQATFERVKKFIAASTPEFQLTPSAAAAPTTLTAR
jgi:hypothetical protein